MKQLINFLNVFLLVGMFVITALVINSTRKTFPLFIVSESLIPEIGTKMISFTDGTQRVELTIDGNRADKDLIAFYGIATICFIGFLIWMCIHSLTSYLANNNNQRLRRHILSANVSRYGLVLILFFVLSSNQIILNLYYLNDAGRVTLGTFPVIIHMISSVAVFMTIIAAAAECVDSNNTLDDWDGIFNIKNMTHEFLISVENYQNTIKRHKKQLKTHLQNEN